MANDPTSGRFQLNAQLVEGAKGLAGPAADIASGASLLQAASNAIKGAALDKLLGPTAIFAGGLVGVLGVIRKIVKETQILEKGLANVAKLQQIEGKFTTLLKSAELAKKRIQELYQFTANSPFKFGDVAEANRILQALTKGAFSNAAAMKVVGDSAAATGQDISGMAEKVGKLYSALSSGRSIDKVAFQLQFTGLATEGLIGKLESLEQAGAGFAEQWAEVTKVLAVNEGGMRNEMDTLDALQSKLEDASDMMTKAFAMPFVEAQSRSIRVLTEATKNLTPVLKEVGTDLAVVSGLVTDFKTGVVENTLATRGFATALKGAWEIGKGLFITLTALTAIRAVLGSGKAISFAAGAINTAKNTLAGARAGSGGLAAEVAGTVATQALSKGNLTLAATEGLVATRFAITSRFAAVKAAAMQGAAGATGFAAVANGTLAASSAVAAGAMSLLARVAVATGGAIRGAFAAALANPLGIAVLAIYAAVSGFMSLRGASKEAAEGLKSVKTAASDLARELDRVEAAFQTTDDWASNMNRVTEEIVKAERELAAFKQTMQDRSTFDRLRDDASDLVGFGTGAAQGATQRQLESNVAALRNRRQDQFKYLPTLGQGSKESEAFARDLRTAKEQSDTAFQNTVSLADDRAAVKLLDEEITKLNAKNAALLKVRDSQEKFNKSVAKLTADSDLSVALASRGAAEDAARNGGLTLGFDLGSQRQALAAKRSAAINAPELFDSRGNDLVEVARTTSSQIALLDKVIAATSTVRDIEATLANQRRKSDSELVRNTQRINELRSESAGSSAAREEIQALETKNAVITESLRIVDQEIARAKQLTEERKQRANQAALTETGIGFDKQINAAVSSGNTPEAARLRFVKEIALIEQEIQQAKEQGNSSQRIAALETQRAGIVAQRSAEQVKFAGDAALERERNKALVARNPTQVRAIDDFKTRRDMIEQYKLQGQTEAQAIKDFDLMMKARRSELPRVSADSLQAVGGGGYSAGNDYPREQVTLTREVVKILAKIAEKGAQGVAIN